jgi:TetR/AcrR family transcriptional repressor of nem operon
MPRVKKEMSEVKTAILDSALRRMQAGGFNGFSYREVADDVGIKTSSIHYYFPTKEDLAVAVIRRWSENTAAHIDKEFAKDQDPIRVWTKAFRGTVMAEPHMCPCTVLGASAHDLPTQVAAEIKSFFNMCQNKMISQGLSKAKATEFLSTIIGAMVVANALHETTAYDRATKPLQGAA